MQHGIQPTMPLQELESTLKWEKKNQKDSISISAIGEQVNSPIQAEAMALRIAAEIATKITTADITFITDNQVLVQATDSRDL